MTHIIWTHAINCSYIKTVCARHKMIQEASSSKLVFSGFVIRCHSLSSSCQPNCVVPCLPCCLRSWWTLWHLPKLLRTLKLLRCSCLKFGSFNAPSCPSCSFQKCSKHLKTPHLAKFGHDTLPEMLHHMAEISNKETISDYGSMRLNDAQ